MPQNIVRYQYEVHNLAREPAGPIVVMGRCKVLRCGIF
jgi:hypothetical protein